MKVRMFILEFSDLPKRGILRALFYITGRVRIFLGVCPLCNSDAPMVYECSVCKGFHFHNRYDRPSMLIKLQWLIMFNKLFRKPPQKKKEENEYKRL